MTKLGAQVCEVCLGYMWWLIYAGARLALYEYRPRADAGDGSQVLVIVHEPRM